MQHSKKETPKVAKTVNGIPTTPLRFLVFASLSLKYWVIFGLIIVIFTSIFGQSITLFYKWIIDAVERGDTRAALTLSLVYPAMIFAESVLWRISGWLGMWWTVNIKKNTSDVLVQHTIGHSHNFFVDRFAGSLMNKIGHVLSGMETLVHDILWSIIPLIISIAVTLYFLFSVNQITGWIFTALLTLLVIFNWLLVAPKRRLSKAQAVLGSKLWGQIADLLTNVSVMRLHNGAPYEKNILEGSSVSFRNAQRKSWMYSERVQLLNSFILFLFLTGMLYVMVTSWRSGSVTTGELIFVMALMTALTGKLTFIGRSMTNLARVLGEVQEGLREIVVPHEIIDAPHAQPLTVSNGTIVWQNVTFKYDTNTVFKDFNLTITPGQRVGLVGSSGAGKTTFVSLLLRQHDINGGSILIDGQNIGEVTQDSLRAAIAVVPQEPALFHRTIRENIAYGKPGATDEEIIEVAKKAQAHEFISALPLGYDTLVGERGVKLSGGQKQRVAIARAMLKDAPILVLDEATSALDSESEVAIQKALHTLMKGKTVIAIAHRLSTLREMDRIIVLEAGKIIEDGTHETLKESGGTYQRLWDHQAGGFLVE